MLYLCPDLRPRLQRPVSSRADDEFEDAADDFGSHFTVAVPTNHKRTASNASQVGVAVSCRLPDFTLMSRGYGGACFGEILRIRFS